MCVEVLLKLPPLRCINDFIVLLIELSLSLKKIQNSINVTDNKLIKIPSQMEKFQFTLLYLTAFNNVL
jgi:hypothetical protein